MFVQDQNSPDILVKYESLGWPNDTSLGLETNIKQYGFGQIIGASLSFNSNYSWYAGDGTPGSGEYDVWSVAAHEFGHAVALNHSGAWYDTMYPYYDSGLGWRSLSWHDEDGISWLYYAH